MLSRFAIGSCRGLLPRASGLTIVQKPVLHQQVTRGFRGRTGRRIIDVKNISETTSGIKGRFGPMEVGQLGACGGAVLGLGALCFYGMGMANEPGAVERSMVWPEYVRTRIRDTYMYFGASVAVAAGSAFAVFRSPTGHKFFALCQRHPIISTVGIIGAMFGTGTAMMAVPYSPGFGTKQALWLLNCGVLGLVAAPIGALGGAIALRAAWYTAGIVGGLSTVAACAPSDKFLNWAGPLGLGLGVVFTASIGSMFVPPTSTFGLSLYSVALYGGLVLFSMFLLSDTQKIIRKAENHPVSNGGGIWTGQGWAAVPLYDPINASHHVVMDTLNIFIRMAQILALGGRKK